MFSTFLFFFLVRIRSALVSFSQMQHIWCIDVYMKYIVELEKAKHDQSAVNWCACIDG